ncbi:MAG: hypothetical protein QM500_06595 [Methylococcales bacterium]
MSKSESRVQNKTITIRVTNDIYSRFKAAANDNNRTLGAHVKRVLLGKGEASKHKTIRVPRHDEKLLRKILGQLGKVGCNVNQIAEVANKCGFDGESCHSLYDAMQEIYVMRGILIKALGIEEKNDI